MDQFDFSNRIDDDDSSSSSSSSNDDAEDRSDSSTSGVDGILDGVEDTMRSVGIDFSFN